MVCQGRHSNIDSCRIKWFFKEGKQLVKQETSKCSLKLESITIQFVRVQFKPSACILTNSTALDTQYLVGTGCLILVGTDCLILEGPGCLILVGTGCLVLVGTGSLIQEGPGCPFLVGTESLILVDPGCPRHCLGCHFHHHFLEKGMVLQFWQAKFNFDSATSQLRSF